MIFFGQMNNRGSFQIGLYVFRERYFVMIKWFIETRNLFINCRIVNYFFGIGDYSSNLTLDCAVLFQVFFFKKLFPMFVPIALTSCPYPIYFYFMFSSFNLHSIYSWLSFKPKTIIFRSFYNFSSRLICQVAKILPIF